MIGPDFRKIISLKVRNTSSSELPERQKDGHVDDRQVVSVQEPRASIPVSFDADFICEEHGVFFHSCSRRPRKTFVVQGMSSVGGFHQGK